MTSCDKPDPDGNSDDPGISADLDAAIRRAFESRFDEPLPAELQALVDRVRALEARVRRNPRKS